MKVFNRISSYWLCQLGGWGLVGFSLLFYTIFFRKDILTADMSAKIFIYVIGGIISTHLLREYIKRAGWLLLPIEKMITRLIIGIVATSTLYSLLLIGFLQLFSLSDSSNINFFSKLLVNVLNLGIFIIPWMVIYYFYHYIEKSRRQQLDTLKLEALVKELELKTIKSHINPHFIFNALNSIRALIDENPNRAREAITELSNILRSSMQAEKLETVSFEKELNIVKDYLALEHIRFEARLNVEYQIDEDTLDQPVPPMMLQTLVENAIKHGIGKEIKGGLIKIISDFKGNYHELIVQNSGNLSGQINEEGFGISSTKNRLQLLFGDKSNFEIKQVNGNIVQATVLIPVTIN
ncbi:MAG: sensor histidine kinase [Chitinophagaceae bacterium]